MKIILRLLLILVLGGMLFPPRIAFAQSGGAFYTVQEGDTLSAIAHNFHATTASLLAINTLQDPNVLVPGNTLRIPGFEDLNGEIVRTHLPLGETAHTLSRRLRQGNDVINRLNFLTAPDALYAGQRFYQLKAEESAQTRLPLTSGMSAIELAVQTATNPWLAAEYNDLRGPWSLVQNDTLFLPGDLAGNPSSSLLTLSEMAISPLPLEQGKTTLVQVQSPADLTLSGSLLGYPLHFFPGANGGFVSLQGIPRLAKPGLAEFVLSATTPDGRSYSVRQNLLVEWKDYGFDSPLQVADNVVDPAITEPEFNQLMALTSEAPAEKMWYSAFQPPTPYPDQLTSLYGRLRSYNGSPFEYYHSGMDYAGNETTPVLAPAAGIVVFTGELTVRGNATLISHGWGVYTGYWHQSRIDVSVGDRVEIGQQIGMVGMTGRVTGPHLHFDVIVGGVEVDPEDWLTSIYAGL